MLPRYRVYFEKYEWEDGPFASKMMREVDGYYIPESTILLPDPPYSTEEKLCASTQAFAFEAYGREKELNELLKSMFKSVSMHKGPCARLVMYKSDSFNQKEEVVYDRYMLKFSDPADEAAFALWSRDGIEI